MTMPIKSSRECQKLCEVWKMSQPEVGKSFLYDKKAKKDELKTLRIIKSAGEFQPIH